MTSKTQATLVAEIDTLFADNTEQEITAGDVRTVLTDIVDTAFRSDALLLAQGGGLILLAQDGYILKAA